MKGGRRHSVARARRVARVRRLGAAGGASRRRLLVRPFARAGAGRRPELHGGPERRRFEGGTWGLGKKPNLFMSHVDFNGHHVVLSF